MTKPSTNINSTKFLFVLLFLLIFISCKKDDEINTSEVDDIYVEIIPSNNAKWVDIHAPVKVVVKRQNGFVHLNDLGEWSFNKSFSVTCNNMLLEFSQTVISGKDCDTIQLDFEMPFPYNSEIKIIAEIELVRPNGSGFIKKNLNFTSNFYSIDKEIDFNIVKTVYPDANQSGVDIAAYPEVDFTSEIDKAHNNGQYQYKIVLNEFSLFENSSSVAGNIRWDDSKTKMSFVPATNLKSSTNYNIALSASIQVLIDDNWIAIDTQKYSSSFSTASQQNYILNESDIAYSYPLPNQYNFYIDEYNTGYLKPKNTCSWMEDNNNDFFVRFTGDDIDTIEIKAQYSLFEGFTYNLPQAQLNQNKIYKVELFRGQSGSVLYSHHFRTSNYRTFTEKIEDFTVQNNGIYKILSNGIYILSLNFKNSIGKTELFDYYESEKEIAYTLFETDLYKQRGLVRIETLLDNSWFNMLDDLMYKPLEDNLLKLSWRSMSDIYGPLRSAAYITNDVENVLLTPNEIETGVLNPASMSFSTKILHYQSPIVATDNSDITRLLLNLEDPNYNYTSTEEKFLNTACPSILGNNGTENQIKIKLNYTLPGLETITSSRELILFSDN